LLRPPPRKPWPAHHPSLSFARPVTTSSSELLCSHCSSSGEHRAEPVVFAGLYMYGAGCPRSIHAWTSSDS
jgi:hypothetical protein